ncbi:MAG: response regulator [Rhodobacteraceae bacterium]|nr:MAG: response regulator [Paracoccaceae bacterium]
MALGEAKITRRYLGVRAAVALCLILVGAFGSLMVTVAGQRMVAEKAPIAEALDAANLGLAELSLAMKELARDPSDQRAETLVGEIGRAARKLRVAHGMLFAAAARGALAPETQRIVDDPTLDPLGRIEEIIELSDMLRETRTVATTGAAVRVSRASVSVVLRLLPALKRLQETERAALDDAIADLTRYSVLAFTLTVGVVLAAAFFIHRPMAKHILAAQREALAGRAAAEAASEAKTQFLATMSHEIRTPMNGVIGMTDLLRGTALDPEQRHMTDVIARSGEALIALIDSLLDLAKMEAGRHVLHDAPFDIAETCADVVALFSGRAASKGVDLVFAQTPAVGPVPVIGDAGAVRQILSNLVGNAVKFTLEGSVTLSLRATGPVEGEGGRQVRGLTLSVKDTGVGVPEAAQARIFERFEQADLDTTSRFGGTGLGLAIVRKLAEAMSGAVSVDSRVGEGATFTFRFALPAAEALVPAPARPRRMAAQPSAERQILVAEDNPVNQMVVSAMLKRARCAVTLAEDGAQAVALFRERRPDVVLMDVMMPVMDGYAATRAIRAHELKTGLPRTPIYGLSAHAEADSRDEGLAAGMDGFIGKPVTAHAIDSALAEIFDGARLQSA